MTNTSGFDPAEHNLSAPNAGPRQTEMVYEKIVASAVFGVLVSVVLAVTSYLVESGLRGFFWLLAALVVFTTTVMLADRYFRDDNRLQRSGMWFMLALALMFVSGCIWGVAPTVLFTHENMLFKFLAYTVVSSVAAVSVSSLSSRFSVFAVFSIPLLGAVAMDSIREGGVYLIFSVFVSLLCAYLLRIALSYHNDIDSMCKLDAQNSGLRDKLASLSESSESALHKESLAIAMLDDAGVHSWSADRELVVTHVGQRFRDVNSAHVSDIIGKPLLQLLDADPVNPNGFTELNNALAHRRGFRDLDCTVATESGVDILVQVTGRTLTDDEGNFSGFEGYFRDVTASGTVIRQLTFQNQHDSLTGLINRQEFQNRLSVFVPPVNLRGQVPHVVYIDLRNLKLVNDTLGLAYGDVMFVELAEVLKNSVDESVSVSRLGGGAFGLLLPPADLAGALQITSLALEALNAYRFQHEDLTFSVRARAGIAGVTPRMETAEVVLNCAHQACLTNEEQERNPIGVYRPETDDKVKPTAEGELAELISSLENRSLCLRYQPVRNIETSDVVWVEALLAQKQANGETELVGNRLSEALKHGVVIRFDRWVVDGVLKEISSARHPVDCGVIVNLTPASMLDSQFPNFVIERLRKYNVAPERICFDVTLDSDLPDHKVAADNLNRLVEQGCKVALDDYATVACSMESLKYLPASLVKINHVYLENVKTDETDRLMCQSIVSIALSCNCEVIAESIQDETVLPLLSEMGITLAQGYALGEPSSLADACGSQLPSPDKDGFVQSHHSNTSNVFPIHNLPRRKSNG